MPPASKTIRQAAEAHAPYKPAKYEDADASAIQHLAQGVASPAEQKRALDWIVVQCCATYDSSYRPGTDGDRDTAFAEGRRFAGLQIVKLMKLKIGLLRREEP